MTEHDVPLVIYGPQASGKTRHARVLLRHFQKSVLVDDWNGETALAPWTLALTNAGPPYRGHDPILWLSIYEALDELRRAGIAVAGPGPEARSTKCIVRNCPNHEHEGRLIENGLCLSCFNKLQEGRLDQLPGSKAQELRDAEHQLSEAYLRLRRLLDAFDTPDSPTAEQVWAHTEAKLGALIHERNILRARLDKLRALLGEEVTPP